MTNEEILEGNKLITEFMGAKMIVENYYGINIIKFPDESTKDLFGLKYHSSWDWLMPVVEKIESIKIYSRVNGTFPVKVSFLRDKEGRANIILILCSAFHFKTIREEGDSKKQSVWIAVVEFIKWYNTQNK